MDSSKIDRINELYHKSQSVRPYRGGKNRAGSFKKGISGCHPMRI